MAMTDRDRKMIDKYAVEITWPLGSQGVAAGKGDGELFKYLDGKIEWNQLSPESKELWKQIQPKG